MTLKVANGSTNEQSGMIENINVSASNLFSLRAQNLTKVFKNGPLFLCKSNTTVLDKVNINVAKNKMLVLRIFY